MQEMIKEVMETKIPWYKRRRVLIVLGGLLLAALAAGMILYPRARRSWQAPLGPALELPTYTPTGAALAAAPTETVSDVAGDLADQELASATPAEEVSKTAAPTDTPPPAIEATATPKPLCGGPPVMMVLAVGVDTKDNNYTYGLGDAIRIVRVDFVTPKVTVLSMPRDLWVEIPGISDHYDITAGKLNQSYFYGSPGMGYYDDPGGGAGLMARTLDLNYGLRVDHYGAVNMITFEKIVDAVGGIDIYLPYDVDGTPINPQTQNMGYFYAGQNHFTGDEAMRFIRIRKRYNDITRQDHQTMVLCALKDKVLSPSVLPKIPQIINAFKDSVITDLSPEQLGQLACLLPHLERENLLFTGLPEEILEPSRVFNERIEDETFVMDVDPALIREYVQQFTAGTWPTPSEDGGATCP